VVGTDITSGLPRVVELFEARTPKSSATISDIDGIVNVIDVDGGSVVKVTSSEFYLDEYVLPPGARVAVNNGQLVDVGTALFYPCEPKLRGGAVAGSEAIPETEKQLPEIIEEQPVVARVAGQVIMENSRFHIKYEEREEREYAVPHNARLLVKSGDGVKVGQQLTEGVINPHDILHIMGKEATQQYLIDEIQKVYCSQGVKIHDKHIAIVIRQTSRKVKIISSGDTELLPGELIDRFDYDDINAKVLAEGGEPATAQAVLLGITRASLSKDSWLAAASFQETSRVLANAATKGKRDKLGGLKENVILGKLIPARVLADEEAGLQSDVSKLIADS
jgi:DNA-directed RNA polymerase subunit beta'